MVNKVVLTGRVSSEVRETKIPSGATVTRVDIAVHNRYRDKSGQWREETSFIEIEAYGKSAERLKRVAKKGNLLLIEGQLTQATWIKNNEKRSKIRVKANKSQLISTPKSSTTKKQIPALT
jgi:single-strand DNA-binding protein